MQNLIYIANVRLPTERAHGYQIVKMCEVFARQGMEVSLFIPTRRNNIRGDVFNFYQVEPNFTIKRLWSLDFLPFAPGRLKMPAFLLQNFSFSISVFLRFLFVGRVNFYCRDPWAAFLLSLVHKNVYWEMHDYPGSILLYRLFLPRLRGIVLTTHHKAERIREEPWGKQLRILVAFNGVDLKMFNTAETREEARKKLGLPQDKHIVLYTGHLYEWKGADILLEASKFLSPNEVVYFVGGTDEDIAEFKVKSQKSKVKNVMIAGRKPHAEIPLWLCAADLLVLPNSAKSKISLYDTSPLKLFEYLASGRPLIASRLPSLEEILTDRRTCLFFEPDNPKDLAQKIREVIENQKLQEILVAEGYKIAQENTWEARAKKILDFVGSIRDS